MSKEEKILVEDLDGGYILAVYSDTRENADEEHIKVYKYKEYYHDLESALRDA